MMEMQKTKIEYVDYAWNVVKGKCKHKCFYCYMNSFYERFKFDEKIRFSEGEFNCSFPKKPSSIFVSSNHDLLGEWIDRYWIKRIIEKANFYPQHTFLFLTKNPIRYSEFEFSENCWLGATIEYQLNMNRIVPFIKMKHKNNFISFEPLLNGVELLSFFWKYFKWIIVGALTGKYAKQYIPQKEWVDKIIEQAGEYDVPVFVKDNLLKLYPQYGEYRDIPYLWEKKQ